MEYVNKDKLMRATKAAKLANKEGDEATIKAEYLKLGGLITGEEEQSGPKVLEDLNVAELKKYAKDNEIDLGEATKKDDILAVIQEAQA